MKSAAGVGAHLGFVKMSGVQSIPGPSYRGLIAQRVDGLFVWSALRRGSDVTGRPETSVITCTTGTIECRVSLSRAPSL